MAELAIGIAGGGTGATTLFSARTNLQIGNTSVATSLGGLAGIAGFTRAHRISLVGGSGGASGYQLRLVVGESSTSSGVDFHVDGKSKSFPSAEDTGGDFKFVKADGTNVPFYIERVTGTTPSRVAVIWLALPNGTSADVVFLITGNTSTIPNQSSGTTVFPDFFDSFPGTTLDTSKWTAVNSTGLTVGGGSMRHINNSAQLRSNATFSAEAILEILWNGIMKNVNGHIVGGFGNAASLASNAIGYLWHAGFQDFIRNDSTWIGQGATIAANLEVLMRMTLTTSGVFNFVGVRHENYDTDALLYNRTFLNVVSAENIFIGNRFDGGFDGQALDMLWRWVRIRQQGTAPTINTIVEV